MTRRKASEIGEPRRVESPRPKDSDFEESKPSKRQKTTKKGASFTSSQTSSIVSSPPSSEATMEDASDTKEMTKKESTNATSPFPNWPAPTHAHVQKVFKLLEDKHGKIEMSQDKPSLGLRIDGCNDEEPALIDAVIRARLSAATNDMNASRALMGILTRFGRREKRSGLGIVDWEAVRLAPLEDLYEAIKIGGLGNVKSRSCKAIPGYGARREP